MSTQFIKDLEKCTNININNGQMPLAIYTLILSIRDTSLFSKGIKIHRHWRLKDVKDYFGVKGTAKQCAEQLNDLLTEYKNFQNDNTI